MPNELDEEIVETAGGAAFGDNPVLDRLYEDFNNRFPITTLKSLTLEEYTNLKEVNDDYFCTWVERKMQRLGSIQGATSLKFGIYRYNQAPKLECKRDDQYAWRSDLGESCLEAFKNIRKKIVQVAEAANGDEIDFKAIDDCNLSTMFKWKVAFLYSKKRLLSVYSEDSLRFVAQEKGMLLTKETPISEIQQFLLNHQDCENRWDYTKSLWKQWDNRCKEAYNDFPVDRWTALFNENHIFKSESLDILKKILELGGEATCLQLSERYGDSADHYRQVCVKLAGRIADRLALELEKTPKGEETRWKILFDGREVDSSSGITGGFIWTLKPNLKKALESFVAAGGLRRYFIAKVTDSPNVFADCIRNNHWRMQQRYDHEDQLGAVTVNLTNAKSARKGDILLFDNGGWLYAYGIVKESPRNTVGTISLQEVTAHHHHHYFDEVGPVRFEDCEAYYEQNYPGCNSDWSQYIDVENWLSYCPKFPVNNYGVQSAAGGLSVHSFFPVEAKWAKNKMKELDEHYEKSRTETDRMINETKRLLELKKNIILQGAPGTGKTYATAALALSILGNTDVDYNDHEAVMQRYNSLLIRFDDDGSIKNDGQIGFVTFHQSMDYEDFVEGIKPLERNDSIFYKIQDGIFKAISLKATPKSSDYVDNFEAAWKQLVEALDESNKIAIPLLKGEGSFDIEMNEYGDGLATRTYENDQIEWVRGKSRFFSKDQLYKVYRNLPGIPSGGHDNYRRAIIKEMKNSYGLKEYVEGLSTDKTTNNYVLIIDEINRGNVSKIFGELISLLEADKRQNGTHPLKVTLPYSKESFSVPSNLYIIGTMNTTDRSVGSIDYAVRRRFAFYTLKASEDALKSFYSGKDNGLKDEAIRRFNKTSTFIESYKSTTDVKFDDLMVGHSYFMAESMEDLELKWKYEVLPLLEEYKKDGLLKHSAKIEDVLT